MLQSQAESGGEAKAAAILAVLRGQWLSGLVTDEGCARQILAWTDQAAPAR